MTNIIKVPFTGLENDPSFLDLCREYEGEYVEDMPPVSISIETYRALDKAGTLHTFCAYNKKDHLIGFLTIIVSVLPHYSVIVGIVESLFVTQAARKTGAGLKFIATAERFAKEKGCWVLLFSTPIGSRLCTILPRRGYSPTDMVFAKRLR